MEVGRAPSLTQVRRRASVLLTVIQLGIASTYAFTPPARGASRATVVAYIEGLGPIWIVFFAASGLFLLACSLTCRALVIAHAVCFSVSIFYSGALWASVVVNSPFTFSIAAWASLALVAGHYHLSRAYAVVGGTR